RAVHAGLYLSPHTISVGVIGPGTVGRVLLNQLASQSARLQSDAKLDFRVRGIMTSKRMLLAEGGGPLDTWKAQFDANAVAADFDRFMEHVRVDYLPHTVIIDCTASADIAKRYPDRLPRGIHTSTPHT